MGGPIGHTNAMMAKRTQEPERLVVQISPELMKLIREFRFARQLESRAEAARLLFEDGLRANGFVGPATKRK